ncbi:MAG: transketolase family protein [Erysipelotrichia bacterium]|jgi:transketolase|nr:transketolase family protein [Erysipelotrichia bacterium]
MAKMATREAYGKALAALVQERNDIFVLDADLSKSTKSADAQAVMPSRHFNMGIAEANMMGVAAGIATGGNTVFASSFAMFAVGRAFEQVRNSIAYPKLNVKICATHAGVTLGEDGASHQAIEDIALMRAVPNMRIIVPADDIETMQVIRAVADQKGPFYVRLGRAAVNTVHSEDYVFEVGKGKVLSSGKDIALIACGVMVEQALLAKEALKELGLDVTVVNMATIKPLDKNLVVELAKTHKGLVTCEEHNILGGLGGAVAEVLAQEHPTKMMMIGVNDTFGESGTPGALLKKYGLSADTIKERVLEFSKTL